jgi:hypothetical protein
VLPDFAAISENQYLMQLFRIARAFSAIKRQYSWLIYRLRWCGLDSRLEWRAQANGRQNDVVSSKNREEDHSCCRDPHVDSCG